MAIDQGYRLVRALSCLNQRFFRVFLSVELKILYK